MESSSYGKSYNALANIYRKLTITEKTAFLSCFIAGIIAHGYRAFNLILCNDGIIAAGGNTLYNGKSASLFSIGSFSTGRACSAFFEDIIYGFHTPEISVFVAIFILSMASVFTVRCLNVKSSLSSALIGMLLVVFPAMTYNMTMMSVSYPICVLFYTCAAYYLFKERYFVSFIFMFFALNTYPVYISCYLMLVLSRFIIEVFEDRVDIKQICRYLIFTLIFGIIYFLFVRSANMLLDVPPTDYQGESEAIAGGGIIADIPNKLLICLKRFVSMFGSEVMTTPRIRVFGRIPLVLMGVAGGLSLINANNGKSDDKNSRFESILLFVLYIMLYCSAVFALIYLNIFNFSFFGIISLALFIGIPVVYFGIIWAKGNLVGRKALFLAVLSGMLPFCVSFITLYRNTLMLGHGIGTDRCMFLF